MRTLWNAIRMEVSMIEVIKASDCTNNIGDYDVPIHNAIIIPQNATNGDVIEAMFPDCEGISLADGTISVKYEKHGCWVHYEYDWWNAPYKEVKR